MRVRRRGTARLFSAWGLCPLLLGLVLTTGVRAAPPEASDLLEQVRLRYRSAPSYRANGKAITRILDTTAGTESTIGVSFSIVLARPDLYRVAWTQHMSLAQSAPGAVWNDGDGPRLYQGAAATVTRMEDDRMALSAATGVSMGTAYTIPSLFFGLGEGANLFERLKDVGVDGEEEAAGIRCHVVSGKLPTGVAYRFWISVDHHYLVQIENTLGGPASQTAIPESTPEQLTKALAGMGLEDTEDNRNRVRGLLNRAREILTSVRGTARQLHQEIVMGMPLGPEDFVYRVPDGTRESQRLGDGPAPVSDDE